MPRKKQSYLLGAVHKGRLHKIAKNWPTPLCPQNVRIGSTPPPSPPFLCGHTNQNKCICQD